MKKLIALLLAASLMCTPAFALKGIVTDPEDLPYIPTEGVPAPEGAGQSALKGTPSFWAQPGVEAALDAGLIPQLSGNPGYQDTTTREQFAQLAVQTVQVMLDRELEKAQGDPFQDCQNPAVLKAFAAGIVSGVGDGRFSPDAATNREQISAMICSAIAYVEKETGLSLAPVPASIQHFSDRDTVSFWAVDSMGRLAANGIMAGTSDTTLSPQAPCSLEQSILLLYQVYQRLEQAR